LKGLRPRKISQYVSVRREPILPMRPYRTSQDNNLGSRSRRIPQPNNASPVYAIFTNSA